MHISFNLEEFWTTAYERDLHPKRLTKKHKQNLHFEQVPKPNRNDELIILCRDNSRITFEVFVCNTNLTFLVFVYKRDVEGFYKDSAKTPVGIEFTILTITLLICHFFPLPDCQSDPYKVLFYLIQKLSKFKKVMWYILYMSGWLNGIGI